MNRVLLITSGAFTGTEIQVEFGRLPPAFLPIGNRRLFVHQHAAFAPGMGRVIMSLPEDFTPSALDLDLLRSLDIELVHVPADLSLGQSVVYVVNVTAIAGGQLAILHGDTLLRGIDTAEPDTVSVGAPPHSYEWGHVHVSDGHLLASPPPDAASDLILSGYFSFSDTVRLVQTITRRTGDFVAGVRDYAAQRPLRAITATEWLDFGHANTYHQSRGRLTTERAFNDLQTTPRIVVKSGTELDKIRAESRWFDTLPPTLRAHTPAFLGQREVAGNPGYSLEYLYLPTLADLYVFGRLTPTAWERIFDACDEFLVACAAFPAPAPPATQALFGEKTCVRLEDFAVTSGINIDAPCRFEGRPLPSLRNMAVAAAQAVPPPPLGNSVSSTAIFASATSFMTPAPRSFASSTRVVSMPMAPTPPSATSVTTSLNSTTPLSAAMTTLWRAIAA